MHAWAVWEMEIHRNLHKPDIKSLLKNPNQPILLFNLLGTVTLFCQIVRYQFLVRTFLFTKDRPQVLYIFGNLISQANLI